jgi:glycosyltransferase involved in cell wall biosynthesis
MKIWFPVIRAGSGSDVYVERLVAGLRECGVDACLQWFDRRFEFAPHLLRGVAPPTGTDLIHAISSWSGFAFARPPLPLVVTAFHCVYRNGYPLWKTRVQALYHDFWIGTLEKRSFASAAAVVALTPSAAADFRERFALPSLSIIPGWLDTDVFKPNASPSIADGKTRILIVGNASKRKGMDLLPRLVELLGERFHFTVIGGLRGGHGSGISRVTYKQGLNTQELVHEYQQTDVLVSLSRYEGFGYTALEAMACAKPVVAFDVVGLRDLVMNGETGLLADIDDVIGLSEHCRRLTDDVDLIHDMGLRGHQRVLDTFSKAEAVSSCLDLYVGLSRSSSPK